IWFVTFVHPLDYFWWDSIHLLLQSRSEDTVAFVCVCSNVTIPRFLLRLPRDRLAPPELVHGSKCASRFSFEGPPAIEVGHCRWIRKARRKTLDRRCIQHEAAKLHIGRC